VGLFIGLTFSVSWLMTILFFALGGEFNTPGYMLITIIYMFVPLVSAIIVQRFVYKEPLKSLWESPSN
jgi:hypothetical protein